MASQPTWVSFLVLFISIIGGLLFVNLLLYLFDSPFRISILFSLILTAVLVAFQYFSYKSVLSNKYGL
jgi:hypothetical protein